MNLLITPPFDSPIAPKMLEPQELASILAEHGIHVTDDPKRADLELVGGVQLWTGSDHCRLPHDRVVLIDGEPPQPEYLQPHYTVDSGHFAHVITPLNGAYADCFAFYDPPPDERPKLDGKRGLCQLATYRDQLGNCDDGERLVVQVNGDGYAPRVLCNRRVEVALGLREPVGVDIFGRGWERAGVRSLYAGRELPNFLEQRHAVSSNYRFDLNWENMEIHHYATEKFWSPLRVGTLPVYWGPPDLHAQVPQDTLVDARRYDMGEHYDTPGLAVELLHMGDQDWLWRTEALQDWYRSLPRDIGYRSWVKAGHLLGRVLERLQSSSSV